MSKQSSPVPRRSGFLGIYMPTTFPVDLKCSVTWQRSCGMLVPLLHPFKGFLIHCGAVVCSMKPRCVPYKRLSH